MRWIKRAASAMWVASCVAQSRAESLTELSLVKFAVAMSGNRHPNHGAANNDLPMALLQAGGIPATFAEHVKTAAEPCSLLLLGTGAVGFAVLVLRERFRINPEALIEAQSSSAALPEAVART